MAHVFVVSLQMKKIMPSDSSEMPDYQEKGKRRTRSGVAYAQSFKHKPEIHGPEILSFKSPPDLEIDV